MKPVFILCIVSIFWISASARNWQNYLKAKKLFRKEIEQKNAYGIIPNSYNFMLEGFRVLAPTQLYVNQRVYGPLQVNVISGKGMLLRGNADGLPMGRYVPVKVVLPETRNVCGVVIGSKSDSGDDILDSISLAWKESSNSEARAIADPVTGKLEMKLNLKTKDQRRIIFFDSYPMQEMYMKLFYQAKKRTSLRLALLYDCYHKDMKFIARCGDTVEKNPIFENIKHGMPIHIKCPTNCEMTRPCWGYKIYSEDSPICWTATQYFGHKGSGMYTMYRLERVPFFEDQGNPILNHGIYCRRYNLPYAGYTFDRLYYDFMVDRYRVLYGAK